MLYFVIGLPGRFTKWCDAIRAEIARRTLRPIGLVRADTSQNGFRESRPWIFDHQEEGAAGFDEGGSKPTAGLARGGHSPRRAAPHHPQRNLLQRWHARSADHRRNCSPPAARQQPHRSGGIIDVTGRARRLLDGPHITMPRGSWSLSLKLLCSRETTEHDFLLEVVADRQVASRTIRPQAEGAFEVDLPFALEATTDHPIAIRLSTQRAAFDGAVAVVEASLTTDGAALAETGLPPLAVTGLSA
jgi:hypothetical protein